MKSLIFIFILTIFNGKLFGQSNVLKTDSTNHSEWKKTLTYHSFKVTKNKNYIPNEVLKKIDIDTITEIANPKEKWTSSCNPKLGIPKVKLNWAAFLPDKVTWVISITTGGYSISTTYYLISSKKIETINNSGLSGENFRSFKSKYIAGTLTSR